MKQLTFAVPNSVSEVLYKIESLGRTGELSETACRLLAMFYVLSWDDGFAEFDRSGLALALNATRSDVDCAMSELVDQHLACVRMAENEVVELLALSSPPLTGKPEICWWQFYCVEFTDSWLELGDDSPATG